MSEVHELHVLMDRYLELISTRGSRVRQHFAPAPPEEVVRGDLLAAGYHDRDEVVAFFTWADYGSLDSPNLDLFWETSSPSSHQAVIEEQKRLVDFYENELWPEVGLPQDPTPAERELRFPGPRHWLPILFLDGVEFMSVDCRPGPTGGSVWFLFHEGDNAKIFDSLAEAIETAVYCVEAGIWSVEEIGVKCERGTQPSVLDLANPPWHGSGD
jgi:hypothetical protein